MFHFIAFLLQIFYVIKVDFHYDESYTSSGPASLSCQSALGLASFPQGVPGAHNWTSSGYQTGFVGPSFSRPCVFASHRSSHNGHCREGSLEMRLVLAPLQAQPSALSRLWELVDGTRSVLCASASWHWQESTAPDFWLDKRLRRPVGKRLASLGHRMGDAASSSACLTPTQSQQRSQRNGQDQEQRKRQGKSFPKLSRTSIWTCSLGYYFTRTSVEAFPQCSPCCFWLCRDYLRCSDSWLAERHEEGAGPARRCSYNSAALSEASGSTHYENDASSCDGSWQSPGSPRPSSPCSAPASRILASLLERGSDHLADVHRGVQAARSRFGCAHRRGQAVSPQRQRGLRGMQKCPDGHESDRSTSCRRCGGGDDSRCRGRARRSCGGKIAVGSGVHAWSPDHPQAERRGVCCCCRDLGQTTPHRRRAPPVAAVPAPGSAALEPFGGARK